MAKRPKAEVLNARASELQEKGELAEAIRLYEQAAAAAPRWGTPPYNLGLIYKKQRQWEESLRYNQQAVDLDPKNDAAWWNLGIAATALGRWPAARAAWRGYGIDVPEGEGPVDLPCGYGPIRLDVDGSGEVVWAYRIDPARSVLANIPFPESGHRWQDVVLNDGAPVGYRQYKGKEVPVLGALQLLEASPFGTYVASVTMPGKKKYLVQLAELAAKLEGSAEDWSTSIRLLCKACSEGRPHLDHDKEAAPADGVHLIGIAARGRNHATKILRTWETECEDIQVDSLDDALEPGPSN
jgi:hypothetical protein